MPSNDPEYFRKWYARNRERHKAYCREKYRERRNQLLARYGGRCVCCGESDIRFLTFDHVNNDGAKERGPGRGSGEWFVRQLSQTPRRTDIQLLCWNCNAAKGIYGQCPHQEKGPDRPVNRREEPVT